MDLRRLIKTPPTLLGLRRLQRELAAIRQVVDAATYQRYLWAITKVAPEILRRRSLAPADQVLASPPRLVQAVLEGVAYNLTGMPFGGVREIFARRVYQPQEDWQAPPHKPPPSRFLPQAGELVIDLGANVGLFSLLCAKRGATVLAVDAQRGYADDWRRLLHRNGCESRATFHCALVGAGSGLFADPDNLLSSSHYSGPPAALSIESLLAAHPGREVALLKCDIEGSEFALLDRDLDWLRRVRRIAMEVHNDFGDPTHLRDRLADHGFRAWLTDPSGAHLEDSVGSDGYLFAERLPNPSDPP
jgi:FkbM family methyltransferase